MKYVLQNIMTKKYFKCYEVGGNKETWTIQVSEALQCEILIAEHARRRLFYQSQFVEIVPVTKVNLSEFDMFNKRFCEKVMLQFMDVPLRIDELLENNEYYVAVSQKLYEKLEKEQMSKNPIDSSVTREKSIKNRKRKEK